MVEPHGGRLLQHRLGQHDVYQQLGRIRGQKADDEGIQEPAVAAPSNAASWRTRQGDQAGVSHRADPRKGWYIWSILTLVID